MSEITDDCRDNPWSELIISLLSVNNFPLQKAYDLLPRLRSEQLTDPEELSSRTPPELYAKLVAAGYDRGEFMTYLFAERLASLGAFAKSYGIVECEEVIKGRNTKALESLLLPINGIGPAVLRNFCFLRGIK